MIKNDINDHKRRVLSFLLFILLPWRETQMFRRLVKVQSKEKYWTHVIYKEKIPTLAGNKHLSIQFFPHTPRLSHFLTKMYEPNPPEMGIKVLIPVPIQEWLLNIKDQKIYHNWKTLEKIIGGKNYSINTWVFHVLARESMCQHTALILRLKLSRNYERS